MENLQGRKDKVEKAQREAHEARAWLQFLTQHPEISNVEANRNLVSEYFNGAEITLDALNDSMNSPAFQNMLAYVNPVRDRANSLAVIKKITGDIPVTTKYESNEALAKKAAELVERRALNKKSPEELRHIIQAGSRPVPVEPELGPEWTKKTLLALPAKEFRKLIDRVGTPAINRRLQGLS